MPDREQWMEELVTLCAEAGDTGYRARLDDLCDEHPDVATELRARIAHLEDFGFLGARSAADSASWLPDRIGGYRLTSLLGRGGMGVVFRGEAADGTPVAVKLVRPDLLADARARERFRREALLASRLSHPGICPLLEVGEDDGVPFLVMPVLEGGSLRVWANVHRGERERLLQIVEDHAHALHAAHEAGLVHRDVTPGNLFVTADGRGVVLDFGLARDTTGELATLTMSQEQLGTLPYMAPEQLGGDAVPDRRVDVYALGVILYEVLAGRLPFESAHRSELSRLIQTGKSPRLRRLVPGLSRSLDLVVHKAIDVEPAHRYATAAAFAEDLRRVRAGEPVLARDVGAVVRTRRWVRHHPVAATTISLLSALVLVSAVLVAGLRDALRVQQAAEAALRSRSLEQADPMNSIAAAITAYEADPGPKSIGQLNRVLHNVSLLATIGVHPSQVRDLAVRRLDADLDRVAVLTDGALSLVTLDRRDGTLREERRELAPPGITLRSASFSPDGRVVAWGGNRWHAWRLAAGAARPQQLMFPGHDGPQGEAWSLALDGDGNAWGSDTRRKIWYWPAEDRDTVDGATIFDCAQLDPPVRQMVLGVRLMPDGDLLAWSYTAAWRLGRAGQVRWQWPAGAPAEPRALMQEGRPMTFAAAADEELDRVLLLQFGDVRVLRWSDGTESWEPSAPSFATEAAMTAGGTVVTLHTDGVLRFWRDGAAPVTTYRDADDQVAGLFAVPGTDWLLAAGRGGARTRLDAEGRAERTLLGGDLVRWGAPGPFAISSDGSVLLAGAGVGRLRTWDFDGARASPQVRFLDSPPIVLAEHPDGRQVLVLTEDRRLWRWDPATRESTLVGALPFGIRCRSAAPDGSVALGGHLPIGPRLAIVGGDRGELRTPVLFRDEPENGGQFAPVGIAWLPGDRLVIGCADNKFLPSRIQVLDVAGVDVPFADALRADAEVPIDTGQITCLDATADGGLVAFGCVQGGIRVWRFDGATALTPWRSIDTGGQRVWSIDVAADGTFLVASLENGAVLRWRLSEERADEVVRPRDRPATCRLADGDRMLVEWAPDGVVRALAAGDAASILEVPASDRGVVRDAVVLGGDDRGGAGGLRLATITTDGWLRLWSFDGDALLVEARARRQAVTGSR